MPSAYHSSLSLAEMEISRGWAAAAVVAISLEASWPEELCEDAEEKHVWAQQVHWHILQYLWATFFIEAPVMQAYDCSKLVNEAEKTSSWNAEEDTLYNQHWFISGSVDMHSVGDVSGSRVLWRDGSVCHSLNCTRECSCCRSTSLLTLQILSYWLRCCSMCLHYFTCVGLYV